MTEPKPPAERLLDLFVFGPAGLAITAAEEFPNLVDKGRHRVEGQVHTARLVGQFAVQMGRRQLGQILARMTPRPSEPAAPPAPPTVPSVEERPVQRSGDGAGQPVEGLTDLSGRDGNGTAPVAALAIPGYDSLSASQVVQRLDGLSRPELEDVRSHEVTHRHRRTILHRIDQLLAGVDGGEQR